MKAKINKNLFRVKEGWVITNDEPIEPGDWIHSTDDNTSSLNIFKINKEKPIGFGGSHYNTELGVGILISSCKKIIGTIDFKIEGLLYAEQPINIDSLVFKLYPEVFDEDNWDKNEQYREEFILGYREAIKTYKFSEKDIRIACDYYRSGYTIDTIIYLLSEINEIEFDDEFNIKKIKHTKNEKK